MAKDQKSLTLYKTLKNIKRKLLLKLNHIVSVNGKVSKSTKSSKKNNYNCVQAQIDLLKNSKNNNDTSFGPDFKIYESDCFLQSTTPKKLQTTAPVNRMSPTTTYQLPFDFLVDNHQGNVSVDYINIYQAPPPPLPPRGSVATPPPVFRGNSVTSL